MEKVKLFLIFGFSCIANIVFAQEDTIVRKGLLKGQTTISPSKMLSINESRFYLHGNIEFYTSKKISLSGDAFADLGSLTEDNNTFEYNHKFLFGGYVHLGKNNSDLYVGFQPGLAITKLNLTSPLIVGSGAKTGANPIFSPVIGYNYFVNQYFHFFIQGRVIIGQHGYDVDTDLAEFNFSAGLGFNLNTIKN